VAGLTRRRLEFAETALAGELFGPQNAHLRRIASLSGARLSSRGNAVTISAADDAAADGVARFLVRLYDGLKAGRGVDERVLDEAWRAASGAVAAGTRPPVSGPAREGLAQDAPGAAVERETGEGVFRVFGKRSVAVKSAGQREYLRAIAEADMTFGIGPAGTGKTYLAVAMAVAALAERKVKRLVLTRPAVEAGEKLGFLPGDMVEKVNPYLRPLYDALNDMLDFDRVQEMLAKGSIEIAPLAFMRGRTLNDAFIILDEAQNTTPEQMKMFLTRLGFNSKAVITGDVTQIDLPDKAPSGLIHARRILDKVEGIRFVLFEERDVIRHPLVGRIVNAYERHTQTPAEKEKR